MLRKFKTKDVYDAIVTHRFSSDVIDTLSVESQIVGFCRYAFRHNLKGKQHYNDYWIDVITYDDKYLRYYHNLDIESTVVFPEVTVNLYPKLTPVPIKRPVAPNRNKYKTKEAYEQAYSAYVSKLNEYRAIVYRIAHDDIAENIANKVKPIGALVKGVRYSKDMSDMSEKKKIQVAKNTPMATYRKGDNLVFFGKITDVSIYK